MLTFRELTYVTTIIEEGGFSNAAKKLYVSQPSLSQYIKKIEETLGFPLFDRTAGGVRLTSAGSAYLIFAREVLARRDAFMRTLGELSTLQQGRLKIGVPFYRSQFYIPRLLPSFREKYPGIEIELFERPTPEIELMIARGEIDLAITNIPTSVPNIRNERLMDERMLLAIPPQHPLRDRLSGEGTRGFAKIDLRLAADEPFIMMPSHYRMRFVVDHICMDQGFVPRVVLVTANQGTAQSLVAEGFALSFSPESIILDDSHARRPVYATFEARDYVWPIAVIYQEKGYLSDAARTFIEHAKTVMRQSAPLSPQNNAPAELPHS